MKNVNYMYGTNPYMANNMQCDCIYGNDPLYGMTVAYSYVPYQKAGKLYSECEALKCGTLFPDLDKPLDVYGREFCTCEKVREEQDLWKMF